MAFLVKPRQPFFFLVRFDLSVLFSDDEFVGFRMESVGAFDEVDA